MLLYILLICYSNLFLLTNTDELRGLDLDKIKEWASGFNRHINLINSYGCINQIQSTYDAKAEIVTIKLNETLKNTVDGINKLFNNKNITLHTLVDAAQDQARIYSQQVFNKNKSDNSSINETQSNVTDQPEVIHLTTLAPIDRKPISNQNLSTFYKAIEYSDNQSINRTGLGPNDVYDNEKEYRQLTTPTPATLSSVVSGDQIIENQGELTDRMHEDYRFSLEEPAFRNLFISEEETMQNQLEIDKKINESLNQTNNLNNLNNSNTTSTSNTRIEEETNEVIDKDEDNIVQSSTTVNSTSQADEEEKEKKDFLYFYDTKKIYSPSKPLSNQSIPRQIPDDLSEYKKDKQKEFRERWSTWTPLKTIKNGLFPNYRLNFSASGIHVPLNVYSQQDALKHAIKWSEQLDDTFKENRKSDPYLNFQFFCSNDGFLRIYPLPKWRIPELFADFDKFLDDDELENFEKEGDKDSTNYAEEIEDTEIDDNDPSRALDLYDCRLRDWYIKAAAAPKDVMVLMDSSGSMRGERSIIGENVLINILETLTENDYVSMIRFNNESHPIEDCFNTDFVQANTRNVEKLKAKILELGHKENLEKSELVANYSIMIENAFNMLKNETKGSMCNKIMMLVTDGDLDNYDHLFQELNDDGSVRVFTFLVGREVMSSPNTESIACKNSGYFIHLKDLAEVKEEVQLYVPVLSRSIGLRIFEPDAKLATTFSSIYADQVLLSLTDMSWEKYENKMLEKFQFKTDVDKVQAELMLTMSMPVFNITNGTQTSYDLIGVVGLDIPIDEILYEIPFYRLGVNSHAFILNNNGFLIYHPDMRPLYKGFLKNLYTSLDVLEVELVDDGKEARDENKQLLKIRTSMIDRETDCDELDSKFHHNAMTRIATRKHLICWTPIPNTLFSIAISIPSIYGPYNVVAPFKIEKNMDYSNFFDLKDSQWYVHPKWTYCWDNLYSEAASEDRKEKILLEMTPKEIIQHFLQANQFDSASFTLQDYRFNEEEEFPESKFFCNSELLRALVFDANATKISLGSCSTKPIENIDLKPINAFISTRSGLTRYFSFDSDHSDDEFKRKLSIDETIYKRTVDYSIKYDPKDFIFQLEKSANRTYITASRALLLSYSNIERRKKSSVKREKVNKIRTPYAVIGMQFDYDSFLNSINKPNLNRPTRLYFLDDNGYVLFGYDAQNELIKDDSSAQSGLLLGEYDSDLFEHLVNQTIYRRIKIFDYQAICEQPKKTDTESSFALSIQPTMINFLFKSLFTLINESVFLIYFGVSALVGAVHGVEDKEVDGYFYAPPPNRTQIKSCRKDFSFYELNKSALPKEPKLSSFKRMNDESDLFIIYHISRTNLILVITSDEYEPNRKAYEPKINFEKNKCDRDIFHRKAPYMYEGPVCYPHKEEKNIQACGATGTASRPMMNTFILLVFYSIYFCTLILN